MEKQASFQQLAAVHGATLYIKHAIVL
jgi:hypothetical protein